LICGKIGLMSEITTIDEIDFSKYDLVPIEEPLPEEVQKVLAQIDEEINRIWNQPYSKSPSLNMPDYEKDIELQKRIASVNRLLAEKIRLASLCRMSQMPQIMLTPKTLFYPGVDNSSATGARMLQEQNYLRIEAIRKLK